MGEMRITRRTGVRVLAVGAALALILAACGGDDDDDDAGSNAATTTTTARASDETTTTTGSSGTSEQAATVAIASTDLGDVLVDENGKTLYLFTNDSENSSTCTGGCAGTWPPLTVTGEIVVGDGLDQSMFTTFAREDGAMQVSVNGHPLYTYGPDTNPGDTNGQGVGGVWFAVGADGEQVQPATSGASTGSGSGY
jgi:predicted lipoprotein with Yx(FWY)xxD motif